jgi:uncharacterized repeat protein (TIGR01451 family)
MATTVAAPPADLEVGLSASPDPVSLPGQLTYTLTVTNHGPGGATGVTLIDTLPAGVTFVSAAPGQGTVTQNGNAVEFDLGALAGGAQATATLVVQPTVSGSLTDAAQVFANEADPNPGNNSASVTTTVSGDVRLQLTLLTPPPRIAVGDEATIVYQIANTGTGPATNVLVADILSLPSSIPFPNPNVPISVAPVSAAASQGAALIGPFGDLTWNVGTLAGGTMARLTVTLTALAARDPEDTFPHTAYCLSDQTQQQFVHQDITVFQHVADLSITTVSNPATVQFGDPAVSTVVSTFEVTNNGPDVANAVVHDQLDAGLDSPLLAPADVLEKGFLVSESVSQGNVTVLTPNSGFLSWTVGTLARGASARITIVRTPPGVGFLTQALDVTTDRPDPDPSNNDAFAQTRLLIPSADLSVQVSGLPTSPYSGRFVTATLTVTNNGPDDAFGIDLNPFWNSSVLALQSVTPVGSAPWVLQPNPHAPNGLGQLTLNRLPSGQQAAVNLVFEIPATHPPSLLGDPQVYEVGGDVASLSDDPNPADNDGRGLFPVSDQDGDGVNDWAENLGPNGGDANGDGIPDSQQPNVASLPNAVTGSYVTLVSTPGTELSSVTALSPAGLQAPAYVSLPLGLFSFTVPNLPLGGAVTVEMISQAPLTVNSYFKAPSSVPGPPNPGNPNPPDWFNFTFDGTTGAVFQGNTIVLHFVDNQRGDLDPTPGLVFDPGGPAFVAAPTAADDSYQAQEGQPLTVPAGGVLNNDSDPNHFGLTAVLAGGPAHGKLVLNGDGSFVYTPDAGFVGTDRFTYRATSSLVASTPATVTLTVNDVPVSAAGGLQLAAAEGTDSASQPLATFTDPGGAEPTNSYSAEVLWGDGTHSAGAITFDPSTQRFTVWGHHTYGEEGSYPISVTVRHGSAPDVTVASAAAVADAPLTAAPVAVNAVAGGPFSGAVASFTDPDPNGTPGDYSATILWGDGNTSAGVITPNRSGGYTVSASNTYAAAGTYGVTVQIRDAGGSSVQASGTAAVIGLGLRIQPGLTGGIGFWHNKRGQALITSFNGGGSAVALADWLAATFPNLYGAGAGAHNLAGMTNAQVAAFYESLFSTGGLKLDAQALALALDVYATTLPLGGTAATAYGFQVTAYGLGAYSYNVGPSGPAFGVANNTVLNVYQILQAVNRKAVNGVLFNGNLVSDVLALLVFDDIAEAGSIP